MQPMGSTVAGSTVAERRRVEAVVETLASIHNHGESLGELAHDAKNMVTALSLYCDLMGEPGVLPASHRHYGSELRLVAAASQRLVERLALLDGGEESREHASVPAGQGLLFPETAEAEQPAGGQRLEPAPDGMIDDLGEEVLAARNLLDVVAGPSIAVSVVVRGGARPVRMTSENLIRALMNLVKNSAGFIQGVGAVRISIGERYGADAMAPMLVLTVEDSGCGIPMELLEKVFEPGFTTRASQPSDGNWEASHRGLGLSITRSVVEAAGGRIHAENAAEGGARLLIELPVRTR